MENSTVTLTRIDVADGALVVSGDVIGLNGSVGTRLPAQSQAIRVESRK